MNKLNFCAIEQELHHQEMCDASTAIAVEKSNYFLVASDEDNFLRVYSAENSDKPRQEIDINPFFPDNLKQKEIDIEAAAQIGEIVYWITSHGRNKKGELRLPRRQFFATKISIEDSEVVVKQEGIAYQNLLQNIRDFFQDTELKSYFSTIDLKQDLSPEEEGGINIEGLCSTSNQELLIAFRNPVPDGKALLIPLKNPAELISQKDSSAQLGEPIQLDLEGRGIRSIEYWEKHDCYVISAGAFDDSSNFCLYEWSGKVTETPEKINFAFPEDFRPEAVLFYHNISDRLQILSDDGGIKRDGINECKSKKVPKEQKFFRSIWVKID